MSEREQLQQELVEFLSGKSYFNAPYGILDGIQTVGRGKVRVITFGCARGLDATLYIWGKDRLTLRGEGPAAWKFEIDHGEQKFTSKEAFVTFINEKLGHAA